MTTERLKVVLYNPRAVFYTMPLALLAIGSELDPATYEVVIVDGRLDPDAEATSLSRMLDGAVCLGVTVLTGAPISDALRISRAAKAARPDLPMVWGGWHPVDVRPRMPAPSRCVDVTVQAQGEATFAEIVQPPRARAARSTGALGCTFRRADGTMLVKSAARAACRSTRSARTTMRSIPVERYYALKGKRQLDYISSQGCNFRCAFCSDPFVYGRKWVGHRARLAWCSELRELWQRYRFDDLNFQDETFFTKRDRVRTMARADRRLAV